MDERPVPRLAIGTLTVIAIGKLLLHVAAMQQYGYFRDELYYLASTNHPDWGYVEHPPLSIARRPKIDFRELWPTLKQYI